MCQANDLSQRRHRAAYLAPSADDLYPDTASAGAADDDATASSLIPLLVEVPSHWNHSRPESPPSSAEWLDLEEVFEDDKKSRNQNLWQVKAVDYLKACYRWVRDIFAVVVMCFLGCFVYDVEVRVVKSNRRRMRERRVIVQTEGARRRNRPVRTTSLLRTAEDDRAQPWGFV